ncbi:hypothetical protein F5Y15DRAFT_388744 [Xylariaceae sp. FL0016]|nr:hypothetical protein F5Y15DRAFT_388744 [Xylariaceae sp. FL0016]
MDIPATTYQHLQEWITQQLTAPSLLTLEQREAVIRLERTLRPANSMKAEPVVGDTNWVGILQEFRAAQQQRPNSITGIHFIEGSVDPVWNRWLSTVTVAEHDSPFPGPAGGLYPDGEQPGFARKKDAKQYAAKCAVEWLRKNGHMPQNGTKFPAGHKMQSVKATSQEQPGKDAVKADPVSPTTTLPAPTPASPAHFSPSPFDDTKPSATHEADQLAKALGLPTPAYKIVPSDNGFWRGCVDYGAHTSTLPFVADLPIAVDIVISKKLAKEKLAMQLCVLLRKEKHERDERNQRFMEGLGAPGREGT